MTFDCIVNKIRFSLPPNAMLHNTNDSLAPLCARSLSAPSHSALFHFEFSSLFPLAQQQWKLYILIPSCKCVHPQLGLLAFFIQNQGAPSTTTLKTAMLFSIMEKYASHHFSAQSSPDVIQFELESYNSYGKKRGDFFVFCFGILKRSSSVFSRVFFYPSRFFYDMCVFHSTSFIFTRRVENKF